MLILARTILRSKAPAASKPGKGTDAKPKGAPKKRKTKKDEEGEPAGSSDPKPKRKARKTKK